MDVLSVLCESVAEIRSGLMSDSTVMQSCHWDLKLAAVCTWRTLASYAAQTGNDIPHSMPNCDFVHTLPHWNFTFCFCLVMQNKWTKYFVEVANIFFICVRVMWYDVKICQSVGELVSEQKLTFT